VLEERDQYFTKLKQGIETLYENNNEFPVVLVCYSMGYKVMHYFLHNIKVTSSSSFSAGIHFS